VGLTLAGMCKVVDHPTRDLTITVEAGMTMAALTRVLADQRQRLPIDVPCADRATVGGIVSTNVSGPRRFACGTLRDYVLGLRAVDGRGTEFGAGSRVVKNAAGYDLSKLMIGSLGTLGVITQVTFLVRPIPETSAFVTCEAADFDTVERLLACVASTKTLPLAVEFLAGPAWQDTPLPGSRDRSSVGRLLVGFEGAADEVQWMVEQLSGELRAAGKVEPATIADAQTPQVWDGLTQGLDGVGGDGHLSVSATVLPSRVVDVMARLVQAVPGCSLQAHAGSGVIAARFDVSSPTEVKSLLSGQLRPAASAAGANLVVTSYPEGVGLNIADVWGPPGSAHAVMLSVKEQFDPHRVLNPGRFIFEDR
jgi:glycolate oxidase FAD binding subunit